LCLTATIYGSNTAYYSSTCKWADRIIFSLQNVAAVTSTSTRTPIYKAYAKGENIGDVTAKGESVGNIADLVTIYVLHLVLLFFLFILC
jgi:hypothetical protein